MHKRHGGPGQDTPDPARRPARPLRPLARFAAVLALAACTGTTSGTIAPLPDDLPRFASPLQPRGMARSNADIARDFMDLSFGLESGETLPRLLKYEGPVRIALNSASISNYRPEIDALIRRLRAEAGIDIALADDPATAQLFIEAIPRRSIQRIFPGAACFIIPGVRSWSDFRSSRLGTNLRWSRQTALGLTTIFIPSDSTPQDTRDCLHEEIAQALGPANDLFRIPDTVFNDDNFHSVLTPFDMVILRTLYAPQLANGMSQGDVSARLPSILRRTNPRGQGLASRPSSPDSKLWKSTIERALNRRNSRTQRRIAANTAISIAGNMTPTDHRLGLAVLTLGRIETRRNPERAEEYITSAVAQFDRQFGRRNIRSAHSAIHLALFALRRGDAERAAEIARFYHPVARRAENAVVLSGLLAIEAEALREMGQTAQSRARRLESLKWARYAFGDKSGAIARAQAEIAAFKPEDS